MQKNPEDGVSQDIVCLVPIISMELRAEWKPWGPDQLDSENADLDLYSVVNMIYLSSTKQRVIML